MKANELRIGNLIEYQFTDVWDKQKMHWEEWRVEVDDLELLYEHPDNEDYRPIRITEKKLLELGLEKEERFYFKDEIWFELLENCELRVEGFDLDNNIKYIHTVQNIYFALKGKELTK